MNKQQLIELKQRVEKFEMLELPGQPKGMHMGTCYLVRDLLKAVEELYEAASPIEDQP